MYDLTKLLNLSNYVQYSSLSWHYELCKMEGHIEILNKCLYCHHKKLNDFSITTIFKFPLTSSLFSLKFSDSLAIPRSTSASSPLSYRSFRGVSVPLWSHIYTPYNKWNLLLSGEINASINGITIKWNRRQRKSTGHFNCRAQLIKIMPLWQWWVLTRAYYVKDIQPIWLFSAILQITFESAWNRKEEEGKSPPLEG